MKVLYAKTAKQKSILSKEVAETTALNVSIPYTLIKTHPETENPIVVD